MMEAWDNGVEVCGRPSRGGTKEPVLCGLGLGNGRVDTAAQAVALGDRVAGGAVFKDGQVRLGRGRALFGMDPGSSAT